jgi:hypothetical protein
MPLPDDLSTILYRLENNEQTEADIAALRQLLSADDAAQEGLRQRQIARQLGKYNVNIGQGQDIQIGDRIYYEWNDKAIQALVEAIKNQHNSIPLLPKELPQEEYIRLKDLLAAGRWREANDKTRTIILKVACREQEGWLADEQIQNFPCEVLHIVDRLWVQYSNQRFGFSVQKRIFNESEKDPQAFGDRVGWRIQDAWISASQVIYTPANAPEGHLPWGTMQVITMDNAALDAFVYGLRAGVYCGVFTDWAAG